MSVFQKEHAFEDRSGVAFAKLRQLTEVVIDQFEELQHIYEYANIGIALLDTDLRFIRINKVLAQINGTDVHEHVGKTLHDILSGSEIYREILSFYRRVIETGEAVTNQLLQGRMDPSGKSRRWLCSYYPIKRDGQVRAISTIVIELTPVCSLCRRLDEQPGR